MEAKRELDIHQRVHGFSGPQGLSSRSSVHSMQLGSPRKKNLRRLWQSCGVTLLPDEYNGNVVFELPPTTMSELAKKGGGLTDMDRENDFWPWTKCVTMSAKVGGKNTLYSVNNIRCVGSLKCVNDQCRYYLNEGDAN
ncbi:hypothetical protein R1sor_012629 [Riccia sorocarpa]|uniref:Uncharacterized protein n=1 Tax=Riccia sorocarpa TaxID=122646 RepID=A0ABD3I4C0_9MARC